MAARRSRRRFYENIDPLFKDYDFIENCSDDMDSWLSPFRTTLLAAAPCGKCLQSCPQGVISESPVVAAAPCCMQSRNVYVR
mgnify:CR=1 FL=1